MNIQEFVGQSIGSWKSQRSAHHLAFGHFEAIHSLIDIVEIALDDPALLALCKLHHTDPGTVLSPFRMSWTGETDWDDEQTVKGTCVLAPVPTSAKQGKLLRDQGYAEEMPAIGEYFFTDDDTFVLNTPYDRASAEEKIWFVSPQVRCRVSLIKTATGSGLVTASFSSEIRQT
jgi:phycoerythrin-associated linker protein